MASDAWSTSAKPTRDERDTLLKVDTSDCDRGLIIESAVMVATYEGREGYLFLSVEVSGASHVPCSQRPHRKKFSMGLMTLNIDSLSSFSLKLEFQIITSWY
jgi:hypothetical protein